MAIIINQIIEEMRIKGFNIKPAHQRLVISEYKTGLTQKKKQKKQNSPNQQKLALSLKQEKPDTLFPMEFNAALHSGTKNVVVDKPAKAEKNVWFGRRNSKSMSHFQHQSKLSRQKTQSQLEKTKNEHKTEKNYAIKPKQQEKSKMVQEKTRFENDFGKTLESLSSEIYVCLCQKQIIQNKGSFSLVKKQKFVQFLINFIKNLAHNGHQMSLYDQDLTQLQLAYKKVKICLQRQSLEQKQSKLQLKSKYINIKEKVVQHDLKLRNLNLHIHHANSEKQRLELEISMLNERLTNFSECYSQKQKQLNQFSRKIQEIKEEIVIHSELSEQLRKKVEIQQNQLNQIREKTDDILHFVQRQEQKKILHWVSEAYKKIEEEIYEYASHLQCNAMASSLTWEPKPFRAVEKWVLQEQQRITKFLMSDAEDVRQKAHKMKEFVQSSMRKFRTKDEQMTKMTDFKTECIRKFIKMMEKWIENWQLKQEYLANLRSQFAVQSQKINHLINQLISEDDGNHPQNQLVKLKNLKQLWQKVEINYKYGNSFY